MAGIEGIKKAFEAVKELIKTADLVLEDGKLTLLDARQVPSLIGDVRELIKAVQESMAAGELADVDSAEFKELASMVVELVVLVAGKFDFKAA